MCEMIQSIEKTILINALPATVWNALPHPDLMKQWMGEPDMGIEIVTDWEVGNPIVVTGFHHIQFENIGRVLHFEPPKVLRYNYRSSLSRLPDNPDNYTVIEFRLTPLKDQTLLALALSNFPTESILRHIDFYWTTTLEILKKSIEERL